MRRFGDPVCTHTDIFPERIPAIAFGICRQYHCDPSRHSVAFTPCADGEIYEESFSRPGLAGAPAFGLHRRTFDRPAPAMAASQPDQKIGTPNGARLPERQGQAISFILKNYKTLAKD